MSGVVIDIAPELVALVQAARRWRERKMCDATCHCPNCELVRAVDAYDVASDDGPLSRKTGLDSERAAVHK